MADEIGDQPRAIWRMYHVGVELDAVEAPGLVSRGCIGRAFRMGDDPKAIGERIHPVAMAHPDLMLFTHLPDAVEQLRMFDHLDKGAAELALIGGRHPTAQRPGHGRLAPAHALTRPPPPQPPTRRTRPALNTPQP